MKFMISNAAKKERIKFWIGEEGNHFSREGKSQVIYNIPMNRSKATNVDPTADPIRHLKTTESDFNCWGVENFNSY